MTFGISSVRRRRCSIFQYKNEEIRDKHHALIRATTGEEPCYKEPDKYVENWTGRGLSRKTALELCEGCPVFDLCRDYAMSAEEQHGIWGGTRPVDRGIKPTEWKNK